MPIRMMAHFAIRTAVMLCARVASRRHAAGTEALHRRVSVARDNGAMMRILVLASCLLFVLFLFAQVRTAHAETYSSPSSLPASFSQ